MFSIKIINYFGSWIKFYFRRMGLVWVQIRIESHPGFKSIEITYTKNQQTRLPKLG